MAREYEAKTSKWWVDHNVFMQIKYMILDYDRMKREAATIKADVLFSTVDRNGSSTGPGNPTANKGIMLASLNEKVNAIDLVIFELQNLYEDRICRDNVDKFSPMDAYHDYGSYCLQCIKPEKPEDKNQPAYITWKEYRRLFIYKVAKKLNYF